MRFATSYDALLRPFLQDSVEPALFKNKDDALCAELSRLVYGPFPPRSGQLPGALAAHGFADWQFFEEAHHNTQALALLHGNGDAFVVFRGTESTSLRDVLTDACFFKTAWHTGGKVHRGFARAYTHSGETRWTDRRGQPGPMQGSGFSIRDCLSIWLAHNAKGRIVVTGHSLGGALATLLASEHANAELVTFGAPRVGNDAFVSLFDDPHRIVSRYRGCCDIVSRVPFEWMRFRHPRGLRHIDRNGQEQDWQDGDREIGADCDAARREYRQIPKLNLTHAKLRGMADHAPINYVSALLGRRLPFAPDVLEQARE